LILVDTLMADVVRRDSSYDGYLMAAQAGSMQLGWDGTVPTSRAILRFNRFSDSLFTETAGEYPIVATDSFRLDLTLLKRTELSGLELAVYRLPASVDTSATFGGLDPWFQDSTLVGTAIIPDSVTDGTASVLLPDSAFPTLEPDSGGTALGVVLRAVSGFVDIATVEGGGSAALVRFLRVDSASTEVPRSESRVPSLDTHVWPDRSPPAPDVLVAGAAPATRAFLRVTAPVVLDTGLTVLRATLLLVAAEPVYGAPGDTLQFRAEALSTDVGPKSPILAVSSDASLGLARILTGATDTLRVDITHIVNGWRADTTIPHTVLLRVVPEAGTLGEVRFFSSRRPDLAPALQVTYVPNVGSRP
jgi:hypothetical protein